MRKITLLFCLLLASGLSFSQVKLPKPPMGWMTWNYFADNINEKEIREMADAMVESGMVEAGYKYIFIDDGWQGGRDNRNNIIPDPTKFPSGVKSLADYLHAKGMKLGIYSDAAQLTCAGYTASYGFERKDARTFAQWGIDYLKYDYCGAPEDSASARTRYRAMADALKSCGRDIALGICEWGMRQPWEWGAEVGGQLWRTTGDVRDKWINLDKERHPHQAGYGIMDIVAENAPLDAYAGPGRWNDPDMLVVGLYGKKGPSADLGGVGCNDTEYQSQMSLWCMMAAPLAASNDVRSMNEATKRILLNREVISINQDSLGVQAKRLVDNAQWSVFVKPLAGGEVAVAVLNKGGKTERFELDFKQIGVEGKMEVRDVWAHQTLGVKSKWKGIVASHETKVFRLKKVR